MSRAEVTDIGERAVEAPDPMVDEAPDLAREESHEDPEQRRWFRRVPIELLVLTLLAAVTRFASLGNPRAIVFDEVFFREFALHYKSGTFYFDLHPPLGKLVLAAWGAIAGVDASATGTDPATALRILPALAGTVLIGVVYVLIRQLCGSRRVATLGAGLLLLDNALLVESRFTVMDSMLALFGMGAVVVALAARKHTGRAYWLLLTASAFLAGCTVATKLSGLTALGMIGLLWLADIIRQRRPWRPILGQLVLLAVVPLTVYVMSFAIHFALLDKTGGNYDAYMPTEFQATLAGNPNYSPDAERSFPQKFRDLNEAMSNGQESLSGGKGSHPYSSTFESWPIMERGIFVYLASAADGKSRYIYTLGNPAVWWGTLLGAAIVLVGWIARRKRFAPYKWPLIYLGIGWAANYLPFALIDRPMFLYHYLFALIFSIAFVAIGLGILTGWIKDDGKPWSFPSRKSAGGYWAVLGVALLAFIYFAPLTYGMPLSPEGLQSRMWLDSWR